MLEVALTELVKSAISVAKDILGNRVKEKNKELLQRKRKKENEKKKREDKNKIGLSKEELSRISLLLREEVRAEISLEENITKKSILKHLEQIKEWCGFIGFKDLQGEKRLSDIYIELNTYLMPVRTHIYSSERLSIRPLQETLFSDNQHAVVLGQPGAGKTTSMKKLCSNFFYNLLDSDYNFPILIRFRDLNSKGNSNLIRNYLSILLSINIDVPDHESSELSEKLKDESVYAYINELRPVIILDGFDELQTQVQKDAVLKEIRKFTKSCRKAKIIITCRTGEFNYNLDFTCNFEITSLTEDQIKRFANNWIDDEEKANKFVSDINDSPFSDTAIKPLSLAHLCAIYERTGSIPDRPKTVYKKIVNLLLEEWDEQRSIKRFSRYSKFEPDRKFEFLTHLSYYLTIQGNTAVFTQPQLVKAYLSIFAHFGLPEEQSMITANEIESQTGLFLQTGYLQYEFAHKSLQEYLTAEYLVKLPSLECVKKYIELLGAELAIATSISSNPSLYFSEIVLRFFNRGILTNSFYNAFNSRLSQERPDFYPSDILVLASFTMLTLRGNDNYYISLMKKMLKDCDIGIITNYYAIQAKEKDGTLVMRRIRKHGEYKLKTKLIVPIGYFSKAISSVI